MNKDSEKIIILCGAFEDSYKPLSRAMFWKLFHKYGDSLDALVHSNEELVVELLKRSASITFSIEKLREIGIGIATFLDDEFPRRLMTKLGDQCPPLLYYCGNTDLASKKTVGYVGARNIEDQDVKWTQDRVCENIGNGFGIVSGGAKGIDSIAMNCALNNDGFAIGFLPDNFMAKIKEPLIRHSVQNGRLLLYSHVSPLSAKTRNSFVASAMERNKYIYALANATVVVHSDYNKGGTWAGAKEALSHGWGYVYVWDNKNYVGNQKLIELNGVALSDSGECLKERVCDKKIEQRPSGKQLSIFDYLSKEPDVKEG